jgi:hypothetical protein
MRRRSRALFGAVLSAVLVAWGAASAAEPPGVPELKARAKQSRAEQLRTTREYKQSLDRLLAVRESDVQRTEEQVERTRALVEQGMVARADLDAAERAAAAARSRLEQVWNEALVASSLIAKALAYDELAAARPLSPGGEQSTAALLRYRGTRPWTGV